MTERRRRADRLDLDVRGLIGLMSVVGLFGIVFLQLGFGKTVHIPPEVAGVVGSVVGFYYGSKGAGTIEQSEKINQVHDLVNSRMDQALAKIDDQAERISEQAEIIKGTR